MARGARRVAHLAGLGKSHRHGRTGKLHVLCSIDVASRVGVLWPCAAAIRRPRAVLKDSA